METQKIINLLYDSSDTKAAFENCGPFKTCRTEINDPFY